MGSRGVVFVTNPLCLPCNNISIPSSRSTSRPPHAPHLRAPLRILCSASTSGASPEGTRIKELSMELRRVTEQMEKNHADAFSNIKRVEVENGARFEKIEQALLTQNEALKQILASMDAKEKESVDMSSILEGGPSAQLKTPLGNKQGNPGTPRAPFQGSSDLSVLTEAGVEQAERCKKALENIYFDQCFASPISRAKAVDAKQIYPKEYTIWREDPANFCMNGRYPVRDLWKASRDCWKEILLSPGESFLVVTHKSILRALICTALGLGPERFRSLDINNGGICVFNFNTRGEAMLEALNMTAHMYSDHVYPG